MIKHFLGKICEKHIIQKKSKTPSDSPKSQEVAVSEVMETIDLTHESHTERSELVHEAADEEVSLSFFDHYSSLMSPSLD